MNIGDRFYYKEGITEITWECINNNPTDVPGRCIFRVISVNPENSWKKGNEEYFTKPMFNPKTWLYIPAKSKNFKTLYDKLCS